MSNIINNEVQFLKDEFKYNELERKYEKPEDTNSKRLSNLRFGRETMGDNIDEVNSNGFIKDIKIAPKNENNKIEIRDPIMFHNTSESALKGIVEESYLSKIFFSKENTDNIQKILRYEIYQKKGKVIEYQSSNEINVIMRSIFLQLADSTIKDEIVQQVQYLNKQVVDFAKEKIIVSLEQHDGYIDKLHTLPEPMEFPSYVNKQNYTYDISNII